MKLRNKVISLLLALLFILSNMGVVLADSNNSISIGTPEEFVEFTHNCTLDTWSKGKTITLTANIDLTGYENVTIPAFSGTFNGAGFEISGLELNGSGANQGLFRYVQEGAVIRELTVNAAVSADGEAVNVGGIAGSNAGTIQSCTFNGTVLGKTAVGGIAGTNEESGKIIESTSKGIVNGVEAVGGTVGVNLGMLTKCANHAGVGTDPQEGGSLNIGGIAGYSSGTIESCTNVGTVGTLHTGYNIGGVVGRQEGLVNGAANKGQVYGRKDVGGIVGHAEPTINIIFTDDLLEELNTELKSLYTLIGDTLKDSDKLTADVQKRLKNASDYVNKASTSTNSLLSQLSSTVAGGNNLNSSTSIIYASLGNYSAVMQDMSTAASDLEDAAQQVITNLKAIASISNAGASSVNKAQTAANDLEEAVKELGKTVDSISEDISALRNAVLQENVESMKKALSDLSSHITALGDCFEDIAEAFSSIRKNLAGLMSSNSTRQKEVQDALKKVTDALEAMAENADDMATGVKAINAASEVNWDALRRNLEDISEGAEKMSKSAATAQAGFEAAADAIGDFESSLTALNSPLDKLGTATETGGDSFKEISTVLSKIDSYLTDLSKADPNNSATSLGSSFSTQSQTLYRNIVSLSSELTGLGTDLGNGNKEYSTNVEAINDQLFKVMGLVLEALEETGETGGVTDISDESVSKAATGKIMASTNYGAVAGDRDVGGIVGTMSIENELDQEDENNDTLSADNQYEIMAIVTNCINNGLVTGTKESAGGIAGRMELGTVIECENYGTIEGSGKYTGGIVGLSNASVRKSYSKAMISGESYVGGIVGMANRVDACYAIVVIDGTEYVGAVAGWGDISGELVTGNYYIDNGVAAIDGISYHGIAEPIDVSGLKSRNGLPDGFAAFTITCINDGEVYEKVNVEYGADLSEIVMPEVPAREGFYGSWSDFTTELMLIDQTVYAEYGEYITVVSSDELDEGRAFALAEGEFTKYAKLHVYESEEAAPGSDAWGIWNISFTDTGITEEAVTTIKLLNQTGELANIWQLKDGEWKELDTGRDGQYLVITMTGTDGTFCFRPDYLVIVLIIVILAATVIGITVVVVLMIRGKKKNGGRKKAPKVKKHRSNNKDKSARAVKEKKTARKVKKIKTVEVEEEAPVPEHSFAEPLIPEFHIPEDKPKKLSFKEKNALKRREKCEKRRAKRALERNREAE